MENMKGRKQLRLAAAKVFVESARYATGGWSGNVWGKTGTVPQ